jgi:beta-glucosidase
VSVDVTNTGSRSGEEVVQLYVEHLHSAVSRPLKELKGFERISVLPGQTKTVSIKLPASQLAYWDVNTHAFRVEPEHVNLMIGDSSASTMLKTRVQVE